MIKKIKGVEISGISCCVPKKKIYNRNNRYHKKNERLIKFIGIESRHIVEKNVCTSDLVIKAANNVLYNLKWNKEDIDILILVTQTPDYLTPATSGIIQHKLKLKKNTLVLDINLGCSGYTHGLITIASLMKNLNLSKGLLCVGDVTSKLVNRRDKISNLLFGDAASVTALENKKNSTNKLFCSFLSDGEGFKDIIVPSHSLSGRIKLNESQLKEIVDEKNNFRSNINISLNGPNIFNFAINNVPYILNKVIKKSKNINYCFLHQANKMIQDSIQKQINRNNIIFPNSLKQFGNTSSASIPVTICHNYYNKRLKGYSLLCGFGVGLSASTVLVNLSKTKIFEIIKL